MDTKDDLRIPMLQCPGSLFATIYIVHQLGRWHTDIIYLLVDHVCKTYVKPWRCYLRVAYVTFII